MDGWPQPRQNVRAGTYQIRSQRTGAILQASTNLVETARYLIHDDQKWNVAPAGGGFCRISSAADDQVLTLADATAKVAPATGADNQLWKIDQIADGSYRIKSKGSQLALAAAFKTKPGNGLAFQTFTGDDTQRWVIAPP